MMGKRIRENLAAVLPLGAALSFWLAMADSFYILTGSTKLLGSIRDVALVLIYGCLATMTVVLILSAIISVLSTITDRKGKLDVPHHCGRVIGILIFLAIIAASYGKVHGFLVQFNPVDPRVVFPTLGIFFAAWLVGRITAISIGRTYDPSGWYRMLGSQYVVTAGIAVFVFGTLMTLYRGPTADIVHTGGIKLDGNSIFYYPIFFIAGLITWVLVRWIITSLSNRHRMFSPGLIALFFIVIMILFVRPSPLPRPDTHNPEPSGKGRNVVLISIDTLRYDRLRCNGNMDIQTPNIDALSAESVNFDNCIVPMPVTVPSHCSMLTGQNPRTHGIRTMLSPLPDAFPTIAGELSEEGFTCGGFVSVGLLSGANSALDRGFHYYDDHWILEGESRFFPREIKYFTSGRILNRFLKKPLTILSRFERKAESTVDSAINWLDHVKDEDFFCFMHVYDPHWDYNAPEPYKTMYDPDYEGILKDHRNPEKFLYKHKLKIGEPDFDHLVARYDGEVTYTDHHLGRFFNRLKELGLWDDTMIILTADHGESFEHDYYFGHNDRVYQSTIHVPLIIKPFAGTTGARTDTLCSNMDFLPTIHGMLGLRVLSGLDGEDLSSFIKGTAGEGEQAHSRVFSETYSLEWNRQNYGKMYSTHRGLEKLIFNPYAYPFVPLYQYFNLADDPDEENDLYATSFNVINELILTLKKWADADTETGLESAGAIEEEELRSLQYLN